MDPILTASVLLGLVAVATGAGLAWRAQEGRIRSAVGYTVVRASDVGTPGFGSGATLLQFSTELCSPCRTTHTVLEAIAAELDTVSHVDLDVTNRPDLAGRFNILQTPTTLILDRSGAVRARFGGAPRPSELRAELARILVPAAP